MGQFSDDFHLVDAACHLAATGVHITLFGQEEEDSGGCGPTHTILIVFGYNITLFVSGKWLKY